MQYCTWILAGKMNSDQISDGDVWFMLFFLHLRYWHSISTVIKFSVISRKRHYRKSMRNASRRIRTHLLETDNATFIRVNIKSPASFPEVLFPARKQSRRAVVVVTSFLQFPRVSIPPVLFSVFHPVIG